MNIDGANTPPSPPDSIVSVEANDLVKMLMAATQREKGAQREPSPRVGFQKPPASSAISSSTYSPTP